MYVADLHVHTAVSDCSLTAEEVLQLAQGNGLTHIAFTDHDTTKLAAEHVQLAASYGLTAVPAVELSAYDSQRQKKVHILGFAYQTTEYIEAIGSETLRKRDANCRRQIEILNTLGYQISVEDIAEIAGDCIYKQHILDYLVRTGQSSELFGAIYQNIFKNNGPCHFDIDYPEAVDAVRAIKADGGLAVLAHPVQQDNYEMIPELVAAGLDGIEWNHPSHSAEDCEKAQKYADAYGLFLTGGSDFHGIYEKNSAVLGSHPAHASSQIIFAETIK